MKRLWEKRCMPIKLAGLAMLTLYLYSHPIQFEVLWVSVYIGIAFLSVPVYISAIKVLARARNEPDNVEEEKEYMHTSIAGTYNTNPVCVWLAPAESAFFFVPVLYVGINPITVGLAAALFGAMHYPNFFIRNCIYKSLMHFALALVVLPHGILTVMAGHFFVDHLPLWVMRLLDKIPDSVGTETEPNKGPKSDAQKSRAP